MPKELTLPSGKVAVIEKGKGKDLLQAQIKAKASDEIPYALIAELVEIDGQKLVYEDILELDLEDVIALQGEISGKLTAVKAKEVPAKQEEKMEVVTPITETITALASQTAKA